MRVSVLVGLYALSSSLLSFPVLSLSLLLFCECSLLLFCEC